MNPIECKFRPDMNIFANHRWLHDINLLRLIFSYLSWGDDVNLSRSCKFSQEELLWAFENGFPFNKNVCRFVITNNYLRCLKFPNEYGHLWGAWVSSLASKNGHLECLKYVHENGCPWACETCMSASWHGHLDCLKYAHENGCPWDEFTCSYAAAGGQLECLAYAHENGCPWDKFTCSHAIGADHLDCLKYAYENGCFWDKQYYLKYANGAIREWILAQED